MFPVVLIPVSEYGLQAITPDASASPRHNAWRKGTAKETVGSTQREQREGASVFQYVPVLVLV